MAVTFTPPETMVLQCVFALNAMQSSGSGREHSVAVGDGDFMATGVVVLATVAVVVVVMVVVVVVVMVPYDTVTENIIR